MKAGSAADVDFVHEVGDGRVSADVDLVGAATADVRVAHEPAAYSCDGEAGRQPLQRVCSRDAPALKRIAADGSDSDRHALDVLRATLRSHHDVVHVSGCARALAGRLGRLSLGLCGVGRVRRCSVRSGLARTLCDLGCRDMPGRRSGPSYGLFLLADRQLVQTASGEGNAARGIYAGFSLEYAPPQYNRFSQYYEGRIYGLGLVPSRPLDLVSLVYNRNVYSDLLVNAARRAGNLAHNATNTYSVSYSAHVFHGINLNLGLSYIDNPTPVTYNTHTGSALSTYLGAVTFF